MSISNQKSVQEWQGFQPNKRDQSRHLVQQRSGNLHQLDEVVNVYDEHDGDEEDVYSQLFCVSSSGGHNPYKVTVVVNGMKVNMEIDTGASTTVINEKTFHQLSQQKRVLKLNAVNTVLRTYTGEVIPVVGECELEVECNGSKSVLPAVITCQIWPLSWPPCMNSLPKTANGLGVKDRWKLLLRLRAC